MSLHGREFLFFFLLFAGCSLAKFADCSGEIMAAAAAQLAVAFKPVPVFGPERCDGSVPELKVHRYTDGARAGTVLSTRHCLSFVLCSASPVWSH